MPQVGRRSSMVSLRLPKRQGSTNTFDNFSNNATVLKITTASPTSAQGNAKFPKIRRRASAPNIQMGRRLSLSPIASPAVRRKQREQLWKVVDIIMRQYTDILTGVWMRWRRYLKLLEIFELQKDAARIASKKDNVGNRSGPNIQKMTRWLKMVNIGPTFKHLYKDSEGMEIFANYVEYRKCKKNEILYWQTSTPKALFIPIAEEGSIDTFYKANRHAAARNVSSHGDKTFDEINTMLLSKIEKFEDRQKFSKLGLRKSMYAHLFHQ